MHNRWIDVLEFIEETPHLTGEKLLSAIDKHFSLVRYFDEPVEKFLSWSQKEELKQLLLCLDRLSPATRQQIFTLLDPNSCWLENLYEEAIGTPSNVIAFI